MGLTLQDIIELAVDTYYNCYVWDNEKEKEVYNGTIDDIPDELLESDFSSWELFDGKIGFNIN